MRREKCFTGSPYMHSADIFGGFLRRAGSSPLDGPNFQIEYHLFNDLLGNKQKGLLMLNIGGILDSFFVFFKLLCSEWVQIVYIV
jgi:hypothetical protein